jgi:hypothetical protein
LRGRRAQVMWRTVAGLVVPGLALNRSRRDGRMGRIG